MFEKNMKIAYLIDFYADVLDDHTRDIMKAYYNDDLSLAEIAEDEGISRQGIRHIVKKGEDQLLFLESKLAVARRHEEIIEISDELSSVIEKLETEAVNEECVLLLKELSKKLLKGN
jgi:predicted DNA-binding protein YlxM (UPF0122 family)